VGERAYRHCDIPIRFGMRERRIKVIWPISPILPLKLVATATTLYRSEKEGHINNLPFGENLMKIGLVDPEVIGFQ